MEVIRSATIEHQRTFPLFDLSMFKYFLGIIIFLFICLSSLFYSASN